MVEAHYVAPKTDGTFALRANWARLANGQVNAQPLQPIVPAEPVSAADLQTRTLRQWFYYSEFRRTSPLAHLSPRSLWHNYKARYLMPAGKGKVPSGQVLVHMILGVAGVGFLTHYGKNSKHLYAKHH